MLSPQNVSTPLFWGGGGGVLPPKHRSVQITILLYMLIIVDRKVIYKYTIPGLGPFERSSTTELGLNRVYMA